MSDSDRTFSAIFKGKQSKLEEKIDIDHGLLTKLVDYNVITERHKQDIKVISITVSVF